MSRRCECTRTGGECAYCIGYYDAAGNEATERRDAEMDARS